MDFEITEYSMQGVSGVQLILKQLNWTPSQIAGQVESLSKFSSSEKDKVYVAKVANQIVGYISLEIHSWNNLAQIQGLAVDPRQRRHSIGTKLVREIEGYVKEKKVRGIYMDTPVTNTGGRKFYENLGYRQDYIMTEYYDAGVDGVTNLKLFK